MFWKPGTLVLCHLHPSPQGTLVRTIAESSTVACFWVPSATLHCWAGFIDPPFSSPPPPTCSVCDTNRSGQQRRCQLTNHRVGYRKRVSAVTCVLPRPPAVRRKGQTIRMPVGGRYEPIRGLPSVHPGSTSRNGPSPHLPAHPPGSPFWGGGRGTSAFFPTPSQEVMLQRPRGGW